MTTLYDLIVALGEEINAVQESEKPYTIGLSGDAFLLPDELETKKFEAGLSWILDHYAEVLDLYRPLLRRFEEEMFFREFSLVRVHKVLLRDVSSVDSVDITAAIANIMQYTFDNHRNIIISVLKKGVLSEDSDDIVEIAAQFGLTLRYGHKGATQRSREELPFPELDPADPRNRPNIATLQTKVDAHFNELLRSFADATEQSKRQIIEESVLREMVRRGWRPPEI